MKTFLITTIFTISLILVSCFSLPHSAEIYHLDKLRMGMSFEEVVDEIGDTPREEVKFNASKINAKVHAVQYTLIRAKYFVDVMLIFTDDELVYWGYLNEFARHPDPKINMLGLMAIEEFESLD